MSVTAREVPLSVVHAMSVSSPRITGRHDIGKITQYANTNTAETLCIDGYLQTVAFTIPELLSLSRAHCKDTYFQLIALCVARVYTHTMFGWSINGMRDIDN
jgi:hypothetical protein